VRQEKSPFPRIPGCAPQRDVSLKSQWPIGLFLALRS
jgi:hypothetical protein